MKEVINKTKIELLAPCGNINSFYASINAGANAIYLGGKLFSARAYASNFSLEEIKEMIIYAHMREVKVYVTVNTLIFEDEIDEVINFVEKLYKYNVDGILLQDLGIASYLHQVYPNLVLHASTQLNCHNVSQAKTLIDLGFKRIVLARETPLEVVKEIKKLGIEVEVFIHGALCVSYSGQCLMSSLIGNRSGNRGKCAQPCRNNMVCSNDKDISKPYAISMKDLCSLDHLDELIDLGIDSLKIEGRMKREEYVYEVVSIYRKAIDLSLNKEKYNSKNDIDEMKKLFNRDFTKGFMFNESRTKTLNQNSSSHIGTHLGKVISINKNYAFIKLDDDISINDGIRFNNRFQDGQIVQKMFKDSKDVTSAKKGDIVKLLLYKARTYINDEVIKTTSFEQMKSLNELMKHEKKVKISCILKAFINHPLKLIINHKDLIIEKESSYIVEESQNNIEIEKIYHQLNRIGNTMYSIDNFEYRGDNKAFIPNSIINELRKDAINEIETKIYSLYKVKDNINKEEYRIDLRSSNKPFDVIVQVENEEQLKVCLNYPFTKILINGKKIYNKYQNDERIYLSLPRVNEKDNKLCSDKEVISYLKDTNNAKNVTASPYMNIVNSYGLDLVLNKGIDNVILSYELSKNRIEKMLDSFYLRHNFYPNTYLPVYGYIDLMIIKSCPISTMYKLEKDHCLKCKEKHYYLEDRKKMKFKMIHDENCNTRILNTVPLYLIDLIDELKSLNIKGISLYFTIENEEEVKNILSKVFNLNENKDILNYTRGHYKKDLE